MAGAQLVRELILALCRGGLLGIVGTQVCADVDVVRAQQLPLFAFNKFRKLVHALLN